MFPMKPTQRTGTKTLTSKQLIQRLLLKNASFSQVNQIIWKSTYCIFFVSSKDNNKDSIRKWLIQYRHCGIIQNEFYVYELRKY